MFIHTRGGAKIEKTWIKRGAVVPSSYLGLLRMSDTGAVLACRDSASGGYGGGVFISKDYGANWSKKTITSGAVTGLHMSSNGNLIIFSCNNEKKLYLSLDKGSTWSTISTGYAPTSVVCDETGSKICYVYVTSSARLMYSTNSGAVFTLNPAGTHQNSVLIASRDGNKVYVVGNYAGHKSTDGGATFVSNTDQIPFEGDISDDGLTLVRKDSSSSAVYQYKGSNKTWSVAGYTYINGSVMISGDASTLAISGKNEMYLSKDQGSTWSKTIIDKSLDGYWVGEHQINLTGDKMMCVLNNRLYTYGI